MYKIFFNKVKNIYELAELVRMFLPASAYSIIDYDPYETSEGALDDILIRIPDNIEDKDSGKQYLYKCLTKYTGIKPDWGILTGVRPVKLTGELVAKHGSIDRVKNILTKEYFLSENKADLLIDTYNIQQKAVLGSNDENAVAIYIGIPFCPTRCIYCSFPSNQVSGDMIQRYLTALSREIEYTGRKMKKKGWYPESIYIGGGTPTTLSEEEINLLLGQVHSNFDLAGLKEFTVEAGRPDTITPEKLKIIKEYGAGRISINPQSMKKETLRLIGRMHEPEDIITAFDTAREIGFSVINADLIAGLPEESPKDYISSLEEIIKLKPENITVHTLAVKRASKLKEINEDYSYHQGKTVRAMLDHGSSLLSDNGYKPYYLYRLKQMAGNFENVGYSLPGTESIYNVKIMEENQTIIALGAGGISKIWYPDERRLERVPNVSNYEIYIERIEEMLIRKAEGIFAER